MSYKMNLLRLFINNFVNYYYLIAASKYVTDTHINHVECLSFMFRFIFYNLK